MWAIELAIRHELAVKVYVGNIFAIRHDIALLFALARAVAMKVSSSLRFLVSGG